MDQSRTRIGISMRRLFTASFLTFLLLVSASAIAKNEGESNSPPAMLAEIRDAIDWSKMPKPPGAQSSRSGLSTCTYQAPGTFLEVATFFRNNMPALGWKEDATPIPGVDQKESLYLTFDKGGMRLSINGYRSEPNVPMTITVSNNGNVDIRTIPKPADAKFQSNGQVAAFFTTGNKPEEAADFCRKGILNRGWKEVPDESAKFFAKEGRFVLRFIQNAMEIGVVASRNMAGQTEVSLTAHVKYKFDPSEIRKVLRIKDLSIPANEKEYLSVLDLRTFPLMKQARKRDRQSQAIALSHAMTCQAPGTLEEAIGYHRKEFLERGWTETRFDHEIDDRVEIDFEKQDYLVTVNLGQRKQEDVQISVVNHGNIDPRQLPYPAGVEITPERSTFVNTLTTVSESEATEYYRKELVKSGWKEMKARGRGVYLFLQNASLLQIEIQKDAEGRTALKLTPSLLAAEK